MPKSSGDEHGHVRIAEVNLGEILRTQVARRLAGFGLKGNHRREEHRLRAAQCGPGSLRTWSTHAILGFCAARHLLAGGNADLISIDAGQFVPIPFDELIDRERGRFRVRLVDFWSTQVTASHTATCFGCGVRISTTPGS